jgi:hypothetical protein
VPAGEYRLAVSLDLSPVFGIVKAETVLSVSPPPADILTRRLEELGSPDIVVRRTALLDLRYFPKDGARVGPALLAALDDPDGSIRSLAVSVLNAFPKEAAAATDRLLAILASKEAASHERQNVAFLLARVAPPSKEVETALVKAVEAAEEILRANFENALANYRRRVAPRTE